MYVYRIILPNISKDNITYVMHTYIHTYIHMQLHIQIQILIHITYTCIPSCMPTEACMCVGRPVLGIVLFYTCSKWIHIRMCASVSVWLQHLESTCLRHGDLICCHRLSFNVQVPAGCRNRM